MNNNELFKTSSSVQLRSPWSDPNISQYFPVFPDSQEILLPNGSWLLNGGNDNGMEYLFSFINIYPKPFWRHIPLTPLWRKDQISIFTQLDQYYSKRPLASISTTIKGGGGDKYFTFLPKSGMKGAALCITLRITFKVMRKVMRKT